MTEHPKRGLETRPLRTFSLKTSGTTRVHIVRIVREHKDETVNICSDLKPLSKYSPVMLHLSPATRILSENPAQSHKDTYAQTTDFELFFQNSSIIHGNLSLKNNGQFIQKQT